jgi:Mrp family chromosome partitioning ATPase/capsular polysaccharide biosynthesis protein
MGSTRSVIDHMDTSQLPGRGIKPILSLRKHYRISALIWLVVVLAGLPVAWIKGQSYYAAESVFQVAPNYMKTLSTDKEVELQSNSQYREFVNHLSSTVKRYDVLQRALKKLRDGNVNVQPKALSERKYIEQLQKQIMVRAVPDTYMVRIALEGAKRETLSEIVNAVTTSFLETTKSEQIFGSIERLEMLQANAEKLEGEIVALEGQRVQLSELLGLTTFGDNAINPYDSMLFQAREKFTAASIERAHAEATLQAFLKQRETPTSLGRSLMEMRLQDNGLQALRNEVVKRSEELERNTTGLEDKHPAKRPALAEYESINTRLKAKEADFDQAAYANVNTRLVASVGQTQQVEAEIKLRLKEIEGQSTEYARNFQKAMRLTSDIRKREQEQKEVRDRLNYLQNESSAIGFVRLVTPALPAEMPMGVGKTKLLLIVFLLATVLAVAAAVALDLVDRRIYTVNEAEKLMGIPAAGWQLEGVDRPSQLYAKEQTRRFASTLIRNKTRSAKNVFSFTSVKTVGAATTVILDTAAVLKQLGNRVLVVDANSFLPSSAFNAGVFGLSDLLAGGTGVDSILQTIRHQEVDLAGVGFGTQVGAGVQRLDLLKQAVNSWAQQYDFVLIDLPPVLLSADAELLIDALGQVFMVLEAQSVSKGEVTRAKRVLEKLDPEAVGLFVNNVPMFQGAGYMRELMVETLTKEKFSDFMSLSGLRLQVELLRAQWLQKRMKSQPPP